MGLLNCVKCKDDKDETDFDFSNRETGTRQPFCMECRKLYQKASYERTKARKIARTVKRARTHRDEMKAFVKDLKRGPCMDCGEKFHWFAMDFDHREPEDKKDDISRMVLRNGCSKETLLSEIAKCDLVCATCHRLRTADRLGLMESCPRPTA